MQTRAALSHKTVINAPSMIHNFPHNLRHIFNEANVATVLLQAYTCPPFFQDDWLNDFYDLKQAACAGQQPMSHRQEDIVTSDYRFLYLGPRGTWTPLHAGEAFLLPASNYLLFIILLLLFILLLFIIITYYKEW